MEFLPNLHLISSPLFIFKIKKFYLVLNMSKFTAIVFMSLRYLALIYCATLKFARGSLVFLLLVLPLVHFSQNPSSNEDLIKQADKLFDEENYSGAYKLYSQLVSNFPKDPVYNFRLGVCMIYAEPEKKKCLPYLKFAANNMGPKELKDAKFYLGKGCHINYLFDEAMRNYNDYKLTASSSQLKKLQVDREIRACANGKHLLSNLTDLEVMAKSQLSENDYFRNYKKVGGKLLVKPDEFKSAADKKKKEKSVVFLPNGSSIVYFSSYGENPESGKDIYTASKQGDGTYSKPEKVNGINTEFDEDYPFLHPDGRTLYFASKGHNSMGGYDIFKSVFIEETSTWSTPVNLEFPINSPDDDYLFVTDSLETIAYFSTGRQSPPGKIDVLKVKTKRRPIDVIAMKGNVIPGDPEYSLRSTISVKDIFSQNEIGNFNSEEDGSYAMELPNGGKLLFTVETPGLETQSAQVSLPVASAARPYKQTISYEKGKLKILNYFDETSNDDTYLQYLNVIEKKAKLDVNEGEPVSPALAAGTTNPEATPAKETPTASDPPGRSDGNITATTTPVPDPKKGLNNKELAAMARQDAEEARQEAAQLRRDHVAANETGLKQKEEADKKLAEASDALFKAETIGDEGEKKTTIENGTAQKLAAEKDQAVATKIIQLARSLEEDARTKEVEASLNTEYAKELEKSLKTKDNKASLAKLEDLQRQIADLSSKKNESESLVTEIKSDVELKEKKLADAEQANTAIKTNVEEIRTLITEKETELSKTKKKAAKKELTEQIDELKTDQLEKEKQISANDSEIRILSEELASARTELDVATKITSDNLSPAELATPINQNTTAKDLQDKYKNRIAVNDPQSRSSIEESSVQLNNYNRDLDQLISRKKDESSKTKNKERKLKLSNEIKQAETIKKQNLAQISGNNKKLQDLNAIPVASEPVAKTTFDPITAETGPEAVTKLENLNSQLAVNDNENFDYNGYQNPQAQSLKVEADASINDAIAKQKKLKDDIAASKAAIAGGGPKVTYQQLNTEAEDLLSRSQKIKDEARTKKGAEKTKLLDEAKKLDEDANVKLIDAAEVTRSDNALIVSANQENIQNLITENKSSEADITLAKSLSEEAKLAFRKAADIREEGNSLGNTGGKLGSFSNAEEKEAEAIAKQQQAIDILVKSNPDLKLKTPVTSTTPASSEVAAGNDINSKLQTVNAGLSELAAVKIESYQKLSAANDAEIAQLQADISAGQNVIDNTPSLKTDLISANNKVENAKTLKQTADNAANPNEKLNNLVASIKKQNEAIKQLSAINTSIKGAAANATPTTPSAPDGETQGNPPVAETTNLPATETPKAPENELSALSEINTEKIDVSQLAQKDTTVGQIVNYFAVNGRDLTNPQAGAMVKGALDKLREFEAENARLEESITATSGGPPGVNSGMGTKELHAKADVLLGEAEELNEDVQDFKKQAQAANEGEERNYILAQARALEIQAQDKTIEASDYVQQANEGEYNINSNAITDLMERLKSDNPSLAEELQVRRDEFGPLKTQISNLRAEANALNNKAAKVGAISNAEEKELELIQKQSEVLAKLKKQYPDYVVKPFVVKNPEEQVAELQEKKSQLREKQYAELINLTNAYSLEYESSKNNVPAELNEDQQSVKQNAEDLNAESKRLLIQATQETNENEKIKQLTLAAKAGAAAVEKLYTVLPKSNRPKNELDELGAIGDEIIASNNDPEGEEPRPKKTKKKQKTVPADPVSSSPVKTSVKIDGLEIVEGNAYSASNPIPMNAPMEEGLVFRVQIGAFKTTLPNNAFKGLSPLNGETTNSGYIRYTAGNFNKIETANAVKNDLRSLGYSDAFVVVYFNGKRITLAEALAQMEKEGRAVDPNAPQSLGITSNVNVPKAAVNTAVQEAVTVTKELDKIEGLLYTIQIGVYTKLVTKPQILSLRPIFREQLPNGLYRYTAGIYNNPEKLLQDKARVVDMGIRDAFVSAYLNGKKIPFSEARERQQNDPDLKLEAENPIVFPEKPVVTAPSAFDALLNTPINIEPFRNNVTNYPDPTPENGVKTNEEGICFKVQIGAFSKQVPEDVAAQFSAIRSWPVDNKQINGLFIYNIGNFSEARFAKTLKEEAIRLGIRDAFIAVYRDGKKLYGPEAEGYLR